MARAVLALLLVALLLPLTSGLYIKLTEGEKRCFIEEVPKDTLIHGTFKATDLVTQSSHPAVRSLYLAPL